MKNTSKILALVLIVMTVLMSLSAITVSAATETVTMTFEAKDITVADGQYADGGSIKAGTDDFFTIVFRTSSKTEDNKPMTWGAEADSNYYTANKRLSLAAGTPKKRGYIAFTTEHANATLKVWWVSNEKVNKVDKDGETLTTVASFGEGATKNQAYYNEVTLAEAGTYYFYSLSGTNYIYKIEVSWEVETCDHEGGTATCKDLAVCSKCGVSYGELSEEHNFDKGACTICGTADPNACQHTNMAPATCTAPSICADCGEYTVGEALGHDMVTDAAVPATCTEKGLTEGSHCSRCDEKVAQTEVAALGHTLTFVNTLPTATAPGKTIADCSVCGHHYDFGEVNVMTPGTHVLDAADLAGIAQYSLFDGAVKVVDGVFACHLSYKYKTETNAKTFAADDWTSTHRMNFGGKSEFCDNGEGDDAVPNGGLKNYIQIVTTGETTITIHWCAGGAGREVAVYDMNGDIIMQSECAPTTNQDTFVTTFTLPAGEYLLGNVVNQNYWHKLTVEVEAPHTHSFSDATCTEPAKCECGETEGEALGHNYSEGVCSRCGAADPDYVAPQPPADDQPEQPELNFFQKIMAFIMSIIEKILAFFKK